MSGTVILGALAYYVRRGAVQERLHKERGSESPKVRRCGMSAGRVSVHDQAGLFVRRGVQGACLPLLAERLRSRARIF